MPSVSWWPVVQAFIAVILLLAFAFLVLDMLSNASDEPLVWARRMAIFGSVEAIVFAAVGFVFGREVNRQRAESAEEAVDEAQKARTEAEMDASREQALGEAKWKAIKEALPDLSGVGSTIADQHRALSSQLPSRPGSDSYQLFVADDPQKASAGLKILQETVPTADASASLEKLTDDAGLQSLSEKEIDLEPLAEARGKIERIIGILEAEL